MFAVAPLLRMLDAWLGWEFNAMAPAGAQGLYQTVITLTLSFLVFTFGSLLVAIQVAGGQLTPRIIATLLLRDNVVRYSVGLFVFTLVFAVMALNRVETHVHQLVALLTASLGIACIADFLFLIDYAARLLRPVSVVASVGDEGVAVIRSVYPARSSPGVPEAGPLAGAARSRPSARCCTPAKVGDRARGRSASTLVTLARRQGGVIEVVPQVGDFVADGRTAVRALRRRGRPSTMRSLRAAVAMGPERTLEQDPMFAFRILVDIALKASVARDQRSRPPRCSPSTRSIASCVSWASTILRGEVIHDDAGVPRVIFRTPNWEDFVHLACSEIRACGADNMQIARRMRALLEDVGRALPEYRRPSIETELELLDRTIESVFSLSRRPRARAHSRRAGPGRIARRASRLTSSCMPITGPVPEWLLSVVAAATLFTVMFDVGLAIVPSEFRVVGRVLPKALFAVIVAVPAIAWIVARVFDLPRGAEIGIMLMAIAPGAPVALRRSLGAGGHRLLCAGAADLGRRPRRGVDAVVDRGVRTSTTRVRQPSILATSPARSSRHNCCRWRWAWRRGASGPRGATWLEPKLRRLGTVLLVLLVALALIDVWQTVVGAGVRVALAIVAVTALALAVGHGLGGPDPATRTATAISSAVRNAGLALLVATLNKAAPAITATMLAYLVISALTVIPYVFWRRQSARAASA